MTESRQDGRADVYTVPEQPGDTGRMTDWAQNRAVSNLAYELAEVVRAENRSKGKASETEAWRDGLQRLMAQFPSMTEEDAKRVLDRGMIDTAM